MSRPSRAQRRREERARTPVLIAGAGIVATTLAGSPRFEARPHAELPPKVTGQHRWIATAAYVVTIDEVRTMFDPERLKFLDHENLFELAIGCWDCEQVLGAIEVDSHCPGEES